MKERTIEIPLFYTEYPLNLDSSLSLIILIFPNDIDENRIFKNCFVLLFTFEPLRTFKSRECIRNASGMHRKVRTQLTRSTGELS